MSKRETQKMEKDFLHKSGWGKNESRPESFFHKATAAAAGIFENLGQY